MAICIVNGKSHEVAEDLADTTLLQWLRGALHMCNLFEAAVRLKVPHKLLPTYHIGQYDILLDLSQRFSSIDVD